MYCVQKPHHPWLSMYGSIPGNGDGIPLQLPFWSITSSNRRKRRDRIAVADRRVPGLRSAVHGDQVRFFAGHTQVREGVAGGGGGRVQSDLGLAAGAGREVL